MPRPHVSAITRRLRGIGRRLGPPGNRVPLDESAGERHIDGNHTPSEAGQRQQASQWRT